MESNVEEMEKERLRRQRAATELKYRLSAKGIANEERKNERRRQRRAERKNLRKAIAACNVDWLADASREVDLAISPVFAERGDATPQPAAMEAEAADGVETAVERRRRFNREAVKKYKMSEKGKANQARKNLRDRIKRGEAKRFKQALATEKEMENPPRIRNMQRDLIIEADNRMETVISLLEEARKEGKSERLSKAACIAALYRESMTEQRQPVLRFEEFNFSDSAEDLSNRRLSHIVRSSRGGFKFLDERGDLCQKSRRVVKLQPAFESGYCEIKQLDGKENFDAIEHGERRDLLNVASIGRGSKLLVIGNDVLLCDAEINVYEFHEIDFAAENEELDSGMEIVESENFVMQTDAAASEEWSSKLTEIYADGEFKHREEAETVRIPEELRAMIEASALTERTLALLRKNIAKDIDEDEIFTEATWLKSNDDIFRDYQPEDKAFTILNANPDTPATLAEILMCPVCRKVFHSIEEWHEHRNSTSTVVDKGEGVHSCCIDGCNEQFRSYSSRLDYSKFVEHIQQHFGGRICLMCWKLCATPATAKRHCRGRRKIHCWKCQETFNSSKYDHRHRFRARLCVDLVIGRMCRWCKTEFDTHQEAVVHEQARRSREGFACCCCDYSGMNWTTLRHHMDVGHLNRPTKCPKCDTMFPNERYMQEHLRNHDRTSCALCGIGYR